MRRESKVFIPFGHPVSIDHTLLGPGRDEAWRVRYLRMMHDHAIPLE
jgi:hypothetical protein